MSLRCTVDLYTIPVIALQHDLRRHSIRLVGLAEAPAVSMLGLPLEFPRLTTRLLIECLDLWLSDNVQLLVGLFGKRVIPKPWQLPPPPIISVASFVRFITPTIGCGGTNLQDLK